MEHFGSATDATEAPPEFAGRGGRRAYGANHLIGEGAVLVRNPKKCVRGGLPHGPAVATAPRNATDAPQNAGS
tara:strand:+ start:171 stop:389 length:219 start_codon:yes stop_codon:yes gene_type:complete